MVDLSYQASVEPEPLPGRPNPRFPDEVSPNAFGAQIGKGLEDAGSVLQATHDRVQAQARQTQLTDFHNQAQVLSNNLTHDPETGAFTKQGKDAFGLDQQYLPQFDAQIAPLIAGVADPKARIAAQQTAASMRTQLSEQLDVHELQQHKEFAAKTAQASVGIAQQTAAANYNNPDILASNRDTIDVSLQNLAQQQGWSSDQLDAARQESFSKLHSDVIDRMLTDGKVGMAQHYLDANKGEMDAKTAWSSARTIEAQQREAENSQKQDIADRYQDSMTAAQYGLRNAVQVTRAEMDVLHPKDAQRWWDGLQSMAAAGTQARAYDQQTPEQIGADLKAHEPTQGGPEAAFAIKGYEIRQRAAQQSIAARASDPAQFAIDSGAGWAALNLKDAPTALAQLKSRANTQEQVSTQTGVNTPLLTKQETKAFTGWLDAQAPTDRLQTLQALRQTMPSDQTYAALLKQIAPGSPLTAIAGTTLDKPSAASTPNWYNPTFATSPVIGQRILEGEEILRAKDEKGIASKFPMPGDKDLQAAFQSAIGGASSDLFRGRADTLESYYAAYKAAYAAEANHQGVSNGVINSSIAQAAAQSVIGHATTYGNTSVVVPAGMDPTKFEGAVNTASSQALKGAGYSDSDVEALRSHGLRELGDTLGTGRYVIINGNGDPLKSKGLSVDTSKYALSPNDPVANPANWDKREDGSDKGQGFLGLLKRPDGRVSSEISVGVEVNGKEMEVPTMVPTLNQKELDYLMTNPVGEGHPIPASIIQKATDFAQSRIAAGKSPFAGPGEQVGQGKTIIIDLNKQFQGPNAPEVKAPPRVPIAQNLSDRMSD